MVSGFRISKNNATTISPKNYRWSLWFKKLVNLIIKKLVQSNCPKKNKIKYTICHCMKVVFDKKFYYDLGTISIWRHHHFVHVQTTTHQCHHVIMKRVIPDHLPTCHQLSSLGPQLLKFHEVRFLFSLTCFSRLILLFGSFKP